MSGRLWVPVASGPLARYAAGYGSWLAARGYSQWAVAHRLWQLELLSRWLSGSGLRLASWPRGVWRRSWRRVAPPVIRRG